MILSFPRACLVFFLLHFTCSLQAQKETSLLWEITGNGLEKPSYLFGTIHLICAGDFFLDNRVEKSLRQVEKVVFEIDMDDPSLVADLPSLMTMKNGAGLSSLLSQTSYKRAADFFRDSLATDIAAFEYIRPFLLSGVLLAGIMDCEVKSYETILSEMAKKNALEVEGLETMADQIALFDVIPEKVQAENILSMIDSIGSAREELRNLVMAYKLQNADLLFKMARESKFSMEGGDELFLSVRNRKWIPPMTIYMKNSPTFFAVGAAHLAGKDGLIDLLRKGGYTVTPL